MEKRWGTENAEKRRQRGDLIETYKILTGKERVDPNCFFIICPIAIAYSMGQITRNSSGDEIANVNFLCDDIVHALKIQYTLA